SHCVCIASALLSHCSSSTSSESLEPLSLLAFCHLACAAFRAFSDLSSLLFIRLINELDQNYSPSDSNNLNSFMQSDTNLCAASALHCICIASAFQAYFVSLIL